MTWFTEFMNGDGTLKMSTKLPKIQSPRQLTPFHLVEIGDFVDA